MTELPIHARFDDASAKVASPITVAMGDGVGPEITAATLRVLHAAGARLAIESIEIGERAYLQGHSGGIPAAAWESLRRTKVLLKGPITTPQGSGVKSLNVTLRKSLGLFANVRPCVSYAPFVATLHPDMNVVIVRENEEDLYAGIEHRQTQEVVQCLKLVSRPGTERIIRYAFAYARAHGRKKVTCFTKDNIMKLTDGLFHRLFEEIGAEYPDIEQEHMIVDIGAARLATRPLLFEVVVTPNLYGDIISDIAAEMTGSVGLGASANIGASGAMFEAIHGSAPDIAGKDIANPSGLLLAAVQMLAHLGQVSVAERVHKAWLATIEAGTHTRDIANSETTRAVVGTKAFADALIGNLGQSPRQLAAPRYARLPVREVASTSMDRLETKVRVGVDVFVEWEGNRPEALADVMRSAVFGAYHLDMISNRGVKVWPNGLPETSCTDHWRCRFLAEPGKQFTAVMGAELLLRLARAGIDVVKTEGLFTFDGKPGFSVGQGQ